MHRAKLPSATLEAPSYIIETNKFYRISAKIIGSKLIHLSGFHKDYVEYYLRIKTDYGQWKLKKRYDEFYKLNNKIANKIAEIKELFPPKRLFKNSDTIIGERLKYLNKYLSFLFNKINIFLFDEIMDFIALEKDIIALFIKKYSMLKIDEENYVFMSIKNAFNRMNLITVNTNNKKNNNSFSRHNTEKIAISKINIINENDNSEIISRNDNINYYDAILQYEKKKQASFDWNENDGSTPHLIVIREFLHNLSEKIDNKMEILVTFENFMKKGTKWIKFTSQEITELLVGGGSFSGEDSEGFHDYMNRTKTVSRQAKISMDFKFHSLFEFYNSDNGFNDNMSEEEEIEDDKILGIFHQIGNYENNIILSVGALELLTKLLNTEYNPDAETYINIFKSRKIFEYQYMDLNKIIKSNIGGNKTNLKAMKLLQLIFFDKSRDEFMREIMIDDVVFKQYTNYINKFLE